MSKAHEVYEKAYEIWNPNKVETFRGYGIELAMGERGGSYFKDLDGNEFINMHSNGGVFNLGHKNEEIKEALIKGAELVDAGNHYFPSEYKNDLCEKLLSVSPANMKYVYMLNGGGEANDAAIKFARRATNRDRVISLDCAFHGSTGISMQAGYVQMAEFFHMKPDENYYTHIPYNNLEKLEEVLKKNDTAAVIIETIPATAGFPMPIEGYHKSVEELAHKFGALYIADEVQTGLMRSGEMWASCKFGATPDIIVTGKGLSGGYYPMSAVIMSEQAGEWLKEDGFAHVSSFNASELGCIVSSKAMEIMMRTSTKENVDMLTGLFAKELDQLKSKYPTFLEEIRQCGVIMGLKTTHPMGGAALMKFLIKNGVWAVMANFDHSALQFKPGLLMKEETAMEAIKRLDKALQETIEALGI
jgi:acetylornithine/succinyldiaminopimelate/putrescine aminotransferase